MMTGHQLVKYLSGTTVERLETEKEHKTLSTHKVCNEQRPQLLPTPISWNQHCARHRRMQWGRSSKNLHYLHREHWRCNLCGSDFRCWKGLKEGEIWVSQNNQRIYVGGHMGAGTWKTGKHFREERKEFYQAGTNMQEPIGTDLTRVGSMSRSM